MRYSNGTTAASTASAAWTAVTLQDENAAAPTTRVNLKNLVIYNGGAQGFFRVNAGPACYLPAGPTAINLETYHGRDALLGKLVLEIQRIGATDLSNVYAFAW